MNPNLPLGTRRFLRAEPSFCGKMTDLATVAVGQTKVSVLDKIYASFQNDYKREYIGGTRAVDHDRKLAYFRSR